MKNSNDIIGGIEPATFRHVAQCLRTQNTNNVEPFSSLRPNQILQYISMLNKQTLYSICTQLQTPGNQEYCHSVSCRYEEIVKVSSVFIAVKFCLSHLEKSMH